MKPGDDAPPAAPPGRSCALRVRAAGRVQGVWFRAAAREEARRLGLAGWVRNLPDGDVEALFEGPEERLRLALAWFRAGPPGARVDRVEEHWGPAGGEYADFAILK